MAEYKTVRWILNQMKSNRLYILILALLSIGLSFIRVSFISYSRIVIDQAIAGEMNLFSSSVLLLALFTFLQLILCLVIPFFEDYLQVRVETLLREQLLATVFKKTYSSLKELATGEWLTRFFSDIEIVSIGVITLIPYFLRITVNLFFSFLLLYQLQAQLTIWILVLGLGLFIGSYFFRKKFKVLYKRVQESKDKIQVFLQETLMNIVVTKVFQAETDSLKKISGLHDAYRDVRKKRRKLSILNSLGMQGTTQIGYLMMIGYGSYQIMQGHVTYGTLIALMQLVNNLITPISNLSGLTSRYYALIASSERLLEISQMPNEENSAVVSSVDMSDFKALGFDAVSFSYREDEHVLSDISFKIKCGESIALIGESGKGKSTLYYLMLGLYQPLEGDISLDFAKNQVSYSNLSQSMIRSLFTYVPQGHDLFSGTVRENLLLGQMNEDVSDALLWSALEKACAKDFVKELPDQLDHWIGEQGKNLSVGQQQRLSIARAFLSKAPIILLDEATSALDEETEKQVLENLSTLDEKTKIIVTHRPAALDYCDRQLIVKNGRMSELVK